MIYIISYIICDISYIIHHISYTIYDTSYMIYSIYHIITWEDCILTPLGKRTFLMKSAGGYKSRLLEPYTWGFGPSSGEIGSMRLRSRAHQLDAVHQAQPIPCRNFQCRWLSFRQDGKGDGGVKPPPAGGEHVGNRVDGRRV